MNSALNFDRVVALTADRLGTIDIACPLCGPEKRTAANRARKVLRIWRLTESFAGFCCQRCGEKGHVRDRSGTLPDPVKLARARTEAAERERRSAMERLGKARWLWSSRLPIVGTAAETYLRGPRGYGGPLQATLQARDWRSCCRWCAHYPARDRRQRQGRHRARQNHDRPLARLADRAGAGK